MTEYVVRFLVGGVVVSAFAMLGDVLRPKSFAGLFGAAPISRAVYAWNSDLSARGRLCGRANISAAFIGGSSAWLIFAVLTWSVHRKIKSARHTRTAEKAGASNLSGR